MRPLLARALVILAATPLGACRTGAAVAAAVAPRWSNVSNGLRARLSMSRSHVSNGTAVIATHLELNNVLELRNPLFVTVGEPGITYHVTDGDGRDLPMARLPFDGGDVGTLDLVLPHDSSMRFRVGPSAGWGIPGDQAALIDLGPRFGWALPRDGKPYYLHAVLELPHAKELRDERGMRWHGRLVLPRVLVPTAPEPLDPATLGPLIDELGAKMLANDADIETRHRLSLIDDPRVIPWYVRAMGTDSYDLKSSALDRLARLEGDAALEGLRIGMTTQGGDLGHCATAAVAASCAENIRGGAASALERSPHPQARALLLSMEEDPAMRVRLTVTQAAARMDTPESLALLERRTQDGDATVRGEAVRLLELRRSGVGM